MRTDFKDAIFTGNRKYQMINNPDGTVSFIDKTVYSQQGDAFGAKEVNEIATDINGKQPALVSGTNLKTINGESLLGAGNIFIKGGTLSSEVTATRADVLKGKTTIMHDSNDKIEQGTLEVQSIVNFNLSLYASETVMGAWQLPAKGLYSGVKIVYRTDRYPNDVTDGTVAYEGNATSFTKKLQPNIKCYFTAFSYVTTNYGRLYAEIKPRAEFTPTTVKGRQVFKANGVFTVPAAVRSIQLFMVGGGGGGCTLVGDYGSGGGGGGGRTKTFTVNVQPSQKFNIIIGAGGAKDTNGGATSVAGIGSVNGGNAAYSNGGDGGSGGGASAGSADYGSDGGSDGANGGGVNGGKGQGTTTREFGEANGTLYAAGGGGGNRIGYDPAGKGGAGGGGNGGSQNAKDNYPIFNHPPTSGTANTGSGGGGGSGIQRGYGNFQWAGAGGSGIVIIRWGY